MNGLGLGVVGQAVFSQLSANTTQLDTTERDVEVGVVGRVDPHHTCLDVAGHVVGNSDVLGEDGCTQTVVSTISQFERLFIGGKLTNGQHRTKDLFVDDSHVRRDVLEKRRLDETSSCTYNLEVAVQTWPWLVKIPIAAHLTAWSMSASALTIIGDFPPHSKVTAFKFSAANLAMVLPVTVEPVKEILRIPLWPANAAPHVFPSPVNSWNTPGGKPAFLNNVATYNMDKGVTSEVFKIEVLPAAKAGVMAQIDMRRG